jgi:hypothetical protein
MAMQKKHLINMKLIVCCHCFDEADGDEELKSQMEEGLVRNGHLIADDNGMPSQDLAERYCIVCGKPRVNA